MLNGRLRVADRLRDWAYTLPAPPVLRDLGDLIARVVVNFSRNHGTHMAAGMAFYALLALFPLVLGSTAIAGFFVSSEAAQSGLFEFLEREIPGAGASQTVQDNIRDVVQARGTLGVVSAIVFFLTGRAVFAALQRVVNRAWHVPVPHHFLVQQLREGGMALGAGLVLALSIFVSVFGQVVTEAPGLAGAWFDSVLSLAPLSLGTVVFILIFRYVPATKVYWSRVVPVAVLAGTMFEVSKVVFVWYLNSFASYDRVYGGISAIVVLLLWIYVASIILVVGAELSSEYSRSLDQAKFRWRGGWRVVKGGLAPRTILEGSEEPSVAPSSLA